MIRIYQCTILLSKDMVDHHFDICYMNGMKFTKFYGRLCFHKQNIYDRMNEFKCMNFRYSVLKIVTAHNAQTSINLNIDEYVRIVIISFFPARD